MINGTMLVMQIAGLFVVFALALFLAAGTVVWVAGWVFLILFFGFVIVLSAWLSRSNPGLLQERMTGMGKKDQKSWDKVWFVLTALTFVAWLVLMPLDAVRFRWSHMPAWVQGIGGMVLLISFYFFYRVYRENAYLSPAVRVQYDRQQHVISTGPYRVVRHPMYASAILFFIGTCLLLGSYYGLVVSLVMAAGVAWRAVREERALLAELPGYDEYMSKVRYRLIPYIW